MTDEERVIVLRDMFELNARLERLKALWPNRAGHLDEVEGILRSLLAEAKEMCRRRDFVTEADECRRQLKRSELFRPLSAYRLPAIAAGPVRVCGPFGQL